MNISSEGGTYTYQSQDLAIGIPVHGWSQALDRTLNRLSLEQDLRITNSEIVITNSGHPFDVFDYHPLNITYIPINPNQYWTGAVARIYEYCQQKQRQRILLMNHDCTPAQGCISALLDFQEKNPNVLCHAVLAYLDDPNKIWWAGNKLRFGWKFKMLYKNCGLEELPKKPYRIDSAMGQCLLIPVAAAKKDYLHKPLFPHYFSDSVQTSCMRKSGFDLYILPWAIAYSDQSDLEFKRSRIRVDTLKGLINGWFAPYSTRNLKATFFAQYFYQNNMLGKVIASFLLSAGKIIKPVLEFLKVIRKI